MSTIKWICIAIATIVLMGASNEGCAAETDSGTSGKGKSGKVGQVVKNEGTSYKVTKVTVAPKIGDPSMLGAKAEPGATFVVVQLQMTNTKDETKTFTEASAKLKTKDGTSYDTSDKTVLAFGDQSLLLKDIQPDLPTSGTIAFEVPKTKVKGSKVVIEDLFGNGSVTVDLGV